MSQHSTQELNVEAYALGALDADESEAFELHLAECARCQQELASYARVLHELQRLPRPIPPGMPKLRGTLSRLSRAVLPVAAVLLLTFGTFAGVSLERAQSGDMVMVAAMAATSSREVVLSGAHVEGRAIVGMGRQKTAFVVAGLPPAPNGRGYQVWLVGRTSSSPGMLRRAGAYEVLVVPGDLLKQAQRITVTIEPSGGSANMGQSAVARSETWT
jgi:anti-sigma factor RsiW